MLTEGFRKLIIGSGSPSVFRVVTLRAFRKGGTVEVCQQVMAAFERLSDTESRKQYDTSLASQRLRAQQQVLRTRSVPPNQVGGRGGRERGRGGQAGRGQGREPREKRGGGGEGEGGEGGGEGGER